MKTSKREKESVRGREWLFTALWACAGDARAPKCNLHIPLTFLFQDNLPGRALATEEATRQIIRVPFDELCADACDEGVQVTFGTVVDTLRGLLIGYGRECGYEDWQIERFRYDAVHNQAPFIATVYYKDGDEEHLSEQTFDLLIGKPSWRQQVLFMQAYVPRLSIQKGFYSERPVVRSKIDALGGEAADLACKALAKYTERAYKVASARVLEEDWNSDARLVVRELELEFCLDPEERLVCLSQHLAKVVMRGQAQVLTSKEAANKELADAVDVVTDDLLRLLRFAQNSGLSMLENFNHFDVGRNGFVDVDAFTDGLARLGIGVVQNVAETVLERIGGIGTAFITLSDFERFCRANQDVEAFELAGEGQGASRRAMSRQKPFSARVRDGEEEELRAGRLDPTTGESKSPPPLRASQRPRPNVGRLPPLELSVGDFRRLDGAFANEDDYRQSLYPPAHGVSISLDGKSSLSQLTDPGAQAAMGLFGAPLDERQYQNLGREEITPDTAMKLPPWAYERHKRALRELKNAHARWTSKNEAKLEGMSRVDPALHLDLSVALGPGTTQVDSPIPLPPGTSAPTPMTVSGLKMGGTLEDDEASHLAHQAPPSPAARASSSSSRGGTRRTHPKRTRSRGSVRGGSRGGSRPGTAASDASSNAPSDADEGDERDEYLHVMNGITMSYRIVKGSGKGIMEGHNKFHQTREDLRMTSILELRMQTLAELEAKTRPNIKPIEQALADVPEDVVIADLTTAQRLRLLEERDPYGDGEGAGRSTSDDATTPTAADTPSQSVRSAEDSLNRVDPGKSINFGQFSGYTPSSPPGGSASVGSAGSWLTGLGGSDSAHLSHTGTGTFAGDTTTGGAGDEPSFAGQERFVAFTVVVLPDLFMTLDTMEAAYVRLLERYPLARFIFVGLPGCPHTNWPEKVVLTRDVHTRALSKLMRHLRKQRRLSMLRGEPVIFVAHGTAVPVLSTFAATHMQALPWLATVAAALVFVSGFLKPTKALKKQFRDLRDGMLNTTQHQVNELVTQLHFWEDYLVKHGRSNVLKSFWHSRRGLQWNTDMYGDDDRGQSYRGILGNLSGILEHGDEGGDPTEVLELGIPILAVHGLEDRFVDPKHVMVFQPDKLPDNRCFRDDIDACAYPDSVHVTWLQCGHEVLQERSAYILALLSHLAQKKGMKPEDEWQVVEDLEVDDGELMDVLAIKRAKEKRLRDEAAAREAKRQKEFEKAEKERLAREEEEDRLADELYAREEEESQRLQAEAEKQMTRRLAAEERARKEKEAQDAAAEDEVDVEENKARRERQAIERKKRAKLAAERKRREAEAARDAALAELYEMVRQWDEEIAEGEELKLMEKEDKRSVFAAEYIMQCEMQVHNRLAAHPKRVEIKKLRREAATRKVEERLARKRSEKVEERRRKAEALVQEILNEKLVLPGMEAGGYAPDMSVPDIVTRMAKAAQRVLGDLMYCRQEIVEALQRNKLVQQKTDLFNQQVESLKNELGSLRRELRIKQREPKLFGEDGDMQELQIKNIEGRLATKEETFLELKALAKGRHAQLRAANRAVQIIKIEMRIRDKLFEERINEMVAVNDDKVEAAKGIKRDREFLIHERDDLIVDRKLREKRLKTLERELKRIARHKGDLVDTDVYVAGVLQRARTKELRQHLTEEVSIEKKAIEEYQALIDSKVQDIWEAQARADKARREADKISLIARVFQKTLNRLRSTPVAELMKDAEANSNGNKAKIDAKEREEKRAEKEARRKAKAEVKASAKAEKEKQSSGDGGGDGDDGDNEGGDDELSVSSTSSTNSIVEDIRRKEGHERSRDERKFVGIDIVLNPEKYAHLSVTEAEEMQFDPDYQCTLTKLQAEKIIHLPEQISLASPFLHSEAEYEAHRLLNKFMKGFDDDFYKHLDFVSGDSKGERVEGAEESDDETMDETHKLLASQGVKNDHLNHAEAVYDIILRQSRRDRLRGMGPGDHMTMEEVEWVAMDRILSPHVYHVEEFKLGGPRDGTDLDTSVIPPGDVRRPHMKGLLDGDPNNKHEALRDEYPLEIKHATNRDGDMYQNMRWRYEEGDDVFDYSWECPFDKQMLLQIDRTQIDLLRTDDERTAKLRLMKYFVRDDESMLGRERLRQLKQVTDAVLASVAKIDKQHHHHHHSHHHVHHHEDYAEQAAQAAPERAIKRLWGGWDTVHPASAGTESQIDLFSPSEYSCYRDQPASYAVLEPLVVLEETDRVNESAKQKEEAMADTFRNDPKSRWFIVKDVKELATTEQRRVRGKTILLGREDQLTVFDLPKAQLNSRQNTSYRFDLPDSDQQRILDVTVAVKYRGTFGTKGQYVGRIAVGLYRLPDENDPDASPMPHFVGYAPHHLQMPNTDDHDGQFVILHRPKYRPIKPASFQIVVGSATPTTYSIVVTCSYAELARPIVDEKIAQALEMQNRIPQTLKELQVLDLSLRLAERKLHLCDKLMDEARAMSKEKQDNILTINLKLHKDEEEQTLQPDEVRALKHELAILEVEFAEWSNNFGARWEERKEMKKCINMMHVFQRQRHNEKRDVKEALDVARRDLPACYILMSTLQEAARVAQSLNTTFRGGGSSDKDEDSAIPVVTTPAEQVRRSHKRMGWEALSLEEQKWSVMDQALNPTKYDWLREEEEEENRSRALQGLPKKIRKLNVAVEDYVLDPSEIRHIQSSPFAMLSRREMLVRKLLSKFHDNMSQMLRDQQAIGSGFDKHLAERTRAKNYRNYTKDDKAWVSIDKVLHPELWAYYVHDDINRDAFMDRTGGMATAGQEGEEGGRKSQILKNDKGKEKEKKKKEEKEKEQEKKGGFGFGRLMKGGGKEEDKKDKKKDKKKDNKKGRGDGGSESEDSKGSPGRRGRARTSSEVEAPPQTQKEAPWINPFDKVQIMEIWRTDRRYLRTDDERECYKYLQRYNGPYSLFVEMTKAKMEREKNTSKAGHHINFQNPGHVQTSDVDLRCRQLLLEVDRARTTKNEWMDTKLLHASNQRFPTAVLRLQLEDELDKYLTVEITERERQQRLRLSEKIQDDEDVAALLKKKQEETDRGPNDMHQDRIMTGSSDVPNHLSRQHTAVGTAESGWTTAGNTAEGLRAGTAGRSAADRRKKRGSVASGGGGKSALRGARGVVSPNRKRSVGLTGVDPPGELAQVDDPGHGLEGNDLNHYDEDDDDGGLGGEMKNPVPMYLRDLHSGLYGAVAAAGFIAESGKAQLKPTGVHPRDIELYDKVSSRSEGREYRRMKLKQDDEKQAVHKMRKMVKLTNKTGEALELAVLQNKLGSGGCLACRSNPCRWKPYADIQKCRARIRILADELERVRLDPDKPVWVSDVPQVTQGKGSSHLFKRDDLIQTLMNEDAEMNRQIKLTEIDKEFHDTVRSREEYIEVVKLHGYAIIMWAPNARLALAQRQAALVAIEVADEFVDIILDNMLDGWHFGEFDITKSTSSKHKKQVEELGLIEKIDDSPDADLKTMQLTNKKVARDGNVHEVALNKVEGNIRFGLFLVAVMYFRSMTYLKKEDRDRMMKDPAYAAVVAKNQGDILLEHSHLQAGENEDQADLAQKRKDMVKAENADMARAKKVEMILQQGSQIGEARRRAREEDERDVARHHLQELIRRQQLERDRITTLQRVYRGHVGRKVAKRFAMKMGEMTAVRELLRSAATCCQRHWRGYVGRALTRETRRQMANFISLQRLQETADDEEAYWDTHPYQRMRAQFRSYWNLDKRTDQTNVVINMQNQHKQEVIDKASDYLERIDAEAEAKAYRDGITADGSGGSSIGVGPPSKAPGSTYVSGNTPSMALDLEQRSLSTAESSEFTTFKRLPGEETPDSSVAPTVQSGKSKT